MTLRGTGLPFQGATWGSQLHIVTDWYPGNGDDATQQVLGPRDPPSAWEGMWSRTLLGREPISFVDEGGQLQELVDPIEIHEQFESMQRNGARLRVTLAVRGGSVSGNVIDNNDIKVTNFRIVREGRCPSFEIKYKRHDMLGWSMQWEWAGRGGKRRVADARKDSDLQTASVDVEAAVNAMQAIVDGKIKSIKSTIRSSASTLTLGRLESVADSVTRSVNDALRGLRRQVNTFKQVGDLAAKIQRTPLAVANATIDFSRNTIVIANQFVQREGQIPAEVGSVKDRVADILRAKNYSWQSSEAASRTATSAWILDAKLRKVLAAGSNTGALTVKDSASTRAGQVQAIYICRVGDTPQNVSQKFYQTPDHGIDILRSNRLPWMVPKFFPGQILIIPSLNVASSPKT